MPRTSPLPCSCTSVYSKFVPAVRWEFARDNPYKFSTVVHLASGVGPAHPIDYKEHDHPGSDQDHPGSDQHIPLIIKNIERSRSSKNGLKGSF